MLESKGASLAATLSSRREPAPLGKDNLLSSIEAGLDPFALIASLWCIALYFEGGLPGAYLILTVIVFSITFRFP